MHLQKLMVGLLENIDQVLYSRSFFNGKLLKNEVFQIHICDWI